MPNRPLCSSLNSTASRRHKAQYHDGGAKQCRSSLKIRWACAGSTSVKWVLTSCSAWRDAWKTRSKHFSSPKHHLSQVHYCQPLSRVRFFATLWTVVGQAPLPLGFCRRECWSGLPCPSAGDLPDPETEPMSPVLQADSLPSREALSSQLQLSAVTPSCPTLCPLTTRTVPNSSCLLPPDIPKSHHCFSLLSYF